jgi:cytochrome d ubiquinol oxidase subunit I
MILAAFIVAGCLVALPYAWSMLHGRHDRYHRLGLALPLTMALIATPVQIGVGDWAARTIAKTQPPKLAAVEGLDETTKGAALTVPPGIRIPKLLSLLAFHDPDATVQGLDEVAPDDRPPVTVVRVAFQLMVAIGFGLLALGVWMLLAWRRRRALPSSRLFLWAAVAAGPASVVALEAGWVVTEVGRQPWIVWEVMRVRDAVTDAPGIRYGYFLLLGVYAAMAVATFYVLRRLARVPLPPDVAR